MGDTAKGSWNSNELAEYIADSVKEKERAAQWALAKQSCEFGFAMAELGHNLQWTIDQLKTVFYPSELLKEKP